MSLFLRESVYSHAPSDIAGDPVPRRRLQEKAVRADYRAALEKK